jgi:tetratricopeptide (TPR) repeat protein
LLEQHTENFGFITTEVLMSLKCSLNRLAFAYLIMTVLSTGVAYGRGGGGGGHSGPTPALQVWQADKEPEPPIISMPSTSGGSSMSKREAIHQVLYKIYKTQGKFDLADKEVAALVGLNPNSSLIHQDWGHQLMIAHRWSDALPHYLKATKIEPANADAWACVGDCYMQLGKYAAALEPYKKAVQNQKPGTDYRQRLQIDQQYIENIKQRQLYNDQLKKQKEDSDE